MPGPCQVLVSPFTLTTNSSLLNVQCRQFTWALSSTRIVLKTPDFLIRHFLFGKIYASKKKKKPICNNGLAALRACGTRTWRKGLQMILWEYVCLFSLFLWSFLYNYCLGMGLNCDHDSSAVDLVVFWYAETDTRISMRIMRSGGNLSHGLWLENGTMLLPGTGTKEDRPRLR